MFDRIIHFSIHNKLIIFILLLILIGSGIHSFRNLPIDAVPDITDNQVQIITSSPDLSAQEVERFITYPLEMEMGNIPDLDQIRSISRFGLSVITIVFKEHVDIYWAREQINQKIQKAKAEIPEGMGMPEMGPISTGLGEIYQYVIYPEDGYEDQYDPIELRSIQDWIIKRQIIGTPGVVEVNSSGGYLKQYEIAIDQNKLKSFGLSMPEIFDALAQNNANTGGSYIEKENQTFFIRGEGMVHSMDDLRKIPVAHRNGNPIVIANVADVRIGHAPRFGAVTMNGKGEVVAGQVMMLKGANSQEVTIAVKERIEDIKKSLPEGIVLEPYLDRSKLVNKTTRTVSKNLLEGALIVIFILVLLLGNMRAGLIVASVIPLSMLFAVSMMRLFGVSANLMSLGALDFGLIVDGAVIIVEAIMHQLTLRPENSKLTNTQKESEIYQTSSKLMKSAAFGQIIILIVYIPILFLEGIEGKMFIPMAQTVSFAILGALILCLTYVPMISALLLRNTKVSTTGVSTKIIRGIYKMYAPIRDLAFRFKHLVLVLALALFGLSLFTISRMGGEFIPTLEEGDFALHQILPSGSSIRKGIDVSAKLQDILMSEFPEVEKVVTKIGTAEIPTDIMPLEAGDIYVIMKPKTEWTSADNREEMFDKMEVALNKFPGVLYEFTQPIQMRFNELMTGIRQDIAIKIYGDDLGVLVEKAGEAETILQSMTGIGDIKVESTTGLQQMVVHYERAKMNQYNVTVDQLNDVIKTAFAGKVAGTFYEGEKRFDIVVRLENEKRSNIESLRDLLIEVPIGGFVPISEMADVSFVEGPAQISRDDTKRRITIGVNARNMDIATLINNIRAEFDSRLDLPSGYYLRFGGQFENLERARNRLMVVVPLALALIFFLLFLAFNSIKYALLIFTAIPLSAIGGIWALYLRGMAFSISAGVGFIALFGVAVLNGIVLVAYFNQLKKEGMTDISEIIRVGTKVRMRPVLMTAAVASLGFLPMALSTTAGAEVQRPLATVVIGGLISATFLTLIVLPILYEMIEKWSMPKPSKISAVLVVALGMSVAAQSQVMTIQNALEKVSSPNSKIMTWSDHQVSALQAQSEQPLMPNPLLLSFSGEEFNFDGLSGVQSFNAMKTFRLPSVKQAYSDFYSVQKEGVLAQRDLQIMSLKSRIAQIYINAAYTGSIGDVYRELRASIDRLYIVSSEMSRVGEGSGVVARQAELRLRTIDAEITEYERQERIYIDLLSQWLSENKVEVTNLDEIRMDALVHNSDHPAIRFIDNQAQILIGQSQIASANAKVRPFAGMSLQSVDDNVLFFGYQMGLSIPFAGAYVQSQKQVAELNASALEERKQWSLSQIDILYKSTMAKVDKNNQWITMTQDQINEYKKLIADMDKAFLYGEARYAEVVLVHENVHTLKKKILDLKKDNLLYINEIIHNTLQKLP